MKSVVTKKAWCSAPQEKAVPSSDVLPVSLHCNPLIKLLDNSTTLKVTEKGKSAVICCRILRIKHSI